MAVVIEEIFPPAKTFPTLGDLVNVLVKNVFVLAGVLLFVLLIFGGLKYIISSGGDEKAAEQSKNAITAALIGFLIIFAAYWIVEIISFIMTGSGTKFFNPGI